MVEGMPGPLRVGIATGSLFGGRPASDWHQKILAQIDGMVRAARSDDLGENYDLIVAALSLHHMELEERYGFFRRAYRSLKPGGVFLASEVIADESTAVREQQYQLWREFMERNGEDSAAWYRRHCEKDHPATISFLVATLSKTGFQAPGCFWRYLNFAVLSARKAAASETTPPTR